MRGGPFFRQGLFCGSPRLGEGIEGFSTPMNRWFFRITTFDLSKCHYRSIHDAHVPTSVIGELNQVRSFNDSTSMVGGKGTDIVKKKLPTIMPRRQMCSKTYDTVKDIAIVGAGIAGSYAAWRMRNNGMSVDLYEYSNRIGGRCHTVKFPGIPDVNVEMGAGRFKPLALMMFYCVEKCQNYPDQVKHFDNRFYSTKIFYLVRLSRIRSQINRKIMVGFERKGAKLFRWFCEGHSIMLHQVIDMWCEHIRFNETCSNN